MRSELVQANAVQPVASRLGQSLVIPRRYVVARRGPARYRFCKNLPCPGVDLSLPLSSTETLPGLKGPLISSLPVSSFLPARGSAL